MPAPRREEGEQQLALQLEHLLLLVGLGVVVAEEVQQALGEHQDTVMSRKFLREQGARMHLDGMNGFTLGRLHAIEEACAAAATEDFERAWAHVKDRRIRKRNADQL